MSFTSKIFSVDTVKMSDRSEQIVKGGRHLFPLLPKAFAGVKQIGVIGWGSQGPAQAQNLRDSLAGTGIKVKVGLRAGSSSMAEARKADFTEENGTLGEMFAVIKESDIALLLISDAAQGELYSKVFESLRPGVDAGPVARLPDRPPQERRREAARQHQRHRASARRGWARRCGASTCRARRSTAPASTPASPFSRTSTAARRTTRSAGRWRSARRTPSRRRWSPSSSRTSTASAASCSAPCTA